MSSHQQILDLMTTYCLRIDSGDLESFVELFDEAEWEWEGIALYRGKEELRKGTSGVILYEDGTPRTRHVYSNVLLEIDEQAGTATGQSYVTVWQQTEGFPLQAIFSGRYVDEFERRDGSWRFRSRRIRDPLFGDLSKHQSSARPV